MTDETSTTGKVNISDISGGDTDVGPIVTGSVGADLVGGDKVGHNKIGRDQNITVIHNYNRPVVGPDEADKPSPYRGLSHFGPDDTEFFFGRDAFIQELIARIDQQSFIPVLGASGSGKSSVVLAGLAPKLGESGGTWQFTHFQPGAEPFRALAKALVPLYKPELDELDQIEEWNKLESKFKEGKVHLQNLIELIQKKQPGSRTLLIADQFEELFSLCPDEEIRRHFLQMLTEASQSSTAAPGKAPLVIVATMRADFLGQALEYPALAEVLTQDIKLKPMSRAELQAAIKKPVEHINQMQKLSISFEPGLVEQILDDVERRPGNLPLLEFALALLWGARRGDDVSLTSEAYEELGKVEGALAQHANQVYESLSEAEQEQVQYIFTHHMIQPGEGTGDTRRIASRSEVGEEKWPLVRKLADARLIEIHPPNEAGDDTAEVVHEALIRNWDRIGEWVNQIRAFLVWQKQLRFAMKRWQDTGQDEGALLRGALLAEAKNWLAEREADLKPEECNFIHTSMQTEKEARRYQLAIEIRAQDAEGRDLKGVDLSGANLSEAYLSEANLRDADLRGANLSKAYLSEANLRDADLRGANLSNADLSNADLSEVDLSETNLRWANLRGAVIDDETQLNDKWWLVWEIVTQGAEGRDLSKADLAEADLSEANLSEANLSEANLSEANLSKANLSKANLSEANLSGANLREASLFLPDLSEANLRGANLSMADLRWTDLRGANLRGANLSEADLRWTDLRGAIINDDTQLDGKGWLVWEIATQGGKGRDLSKADLSMANLSEANLRGANLSGVRLSEADLSQANLIGADLSGTNLIWAALSEANLSEANLSEADLSQANLIGANLRGADLKEAKYTEITKWPDDIDPVAAGAVKVKVDE